MNWRLTDLWESKEFEMLITFTATWSYIQEAGTKSYQGDQGIRNKVNGTHTIQCTGARAGTEIRKLTTRKQGTTDVRLDPQLNKKVWEAGVKGVPYRLRVRISRKRNDEEGAKERLYSYVQAVNVKDCKGLQTALVEDA